MITPDQIRAARALLRWDAAMLGKKADCSVRTVSAVEAGKGRSDRMDKAHARLVAALEAAGIELIAENAGGAGVRLWKP